MRRFISTKLADWASSSRRKPLLVRGARQVGKTYSINELGRSAFQNTVVIDLERNRAWHRVFERDLDARRIVAELEVVASAKIEAKKTLLFIDEIQACPHAIMALRYFYEEMPELHVVAAGSLLEFAFSEISIPVGRIQYLEMRPLTFAEYLWAIGNDPGAEAILSVPRALPEATHSHLLEELKRYCFIGGMPESVLAYSSSKSIQEAFSVQKELCEAYRQDFSKYAPRSDPRCLDEVLMAVAQNVGHQVKYAKLVESFSGPTIKAAFDLLCTARVIKRVPSAKPTGLPLGRTASPKRFKAILVDVGLWQHLCGMQASTEYAKGELLNIYRGAMAEQLVGQELTAAQEGELYYWARDARNSSAELDYLTVVGGEIHGVEVKSGAAGRLRSLHMMQQEHPQTGDGFVFSMAPYAEVPEQKLKFIPLYFAYSATRARSPE